MRKTRKQRRQSRKSKQRGGKQIFLKSPVSSEKPIQMNVTNSTTPRNVLYQFLQRSSFSKHPVFGLYKRTNLENPPYRFLMPGSKQELNFTDKWNHPWTIPFEKNGTYNVKPIPKLAEQIGNKDFLEAQRSFQLITHLLEQLPVAKIIIASAAMEREHDSKNVNQQFKFCLPPCGPIVLIDNAFFKKPTFDFYKYLDFEEIIDETNLGPKDMIRLYRKTAGKELSINISDNGISKEEKENYLKEVKTQAGRAEFDVRNEIRIYCVNHNLLYESNIEKGISISEFIKGNQKMYGWEDGKCDENIGATPRRCSTNNSSKQVYGKGGED